VDLYLRTAKIDVIPVKFCTSMIDFLTMELVFELTRWMLQCVLDSASSFVAFVPCDYSVFSCITVLVVL